MRTPAAMARPEAAGPRASRQRSLVDELLALQAQDGVSAAELSRRLDVDESLYSRVQRGRARFGVTVCARIVDAYPQLADAAAAYLGDVYELNELRLLARAQSIREGQRLVAPLVGSVEDVAS